MKVQTTPLKGLFLVQPTKHGDHRGFFSETFKAHVLEQNGVHLNWIQDNHSFSAAAGVVRGLHFQRPPNAQAKLVRVTRGAIIDVAVDIRRSSATFGQHFAVELSEENWTQLLVPIGFAHGFCTIVGNTEVQYKVTSPYSPSDEGGLRWNDPVLGISWPVTQAGPILAERDKSWPTLSELVETGFD